MEPQALAQCGHQGHIIEILYICQPPIYISRQCSQSIIIVVLHFLAEKVRLIYAYFLNFLNAGHVGFVKLTK